MKTNDMNPAVLLVEDHPFFRSGLRQFIGLSLPAATIVGEAETAAAAIDLVRQHRPQLVIMDVHLPDGNGIELSRQILDELPETRIIILSAESGLSFVQQALRIGISGYLLKSNAPEALSPAVHAAMAGRLYLCPEVSHAVFDDYRQTLSGKDEPTRPRLSQRELDVLRLIADGLRTKEIAERLNVGVKTAETYRQRVIQKLGCSGTAELVRFAIRQGLVPP